jgi:CheY-like chemotaxis protein
MLKGPFRSVFCIDDNETDRFIAERYLKNLLVNPDVMLFSNAQDAIDKLMNFGQSNTNELPDYILLDLNMPYVDGWAFLDEIYRLKIDLWCPSNVYILSSSVCLEDINKSKLYPIVKGFITKPLNQHKFKASLLSAYQRY